MKVSSSDSCISKLEVMSDRIICRDSNFLEIWFTLRVRSEKSTVLQVSVSFGVYESGIFIGDIKEH